MDGSIEKLFIQFIDSLSDILGIQDTSKPLPERFMHITEKIQLIVNRERNFCQTAEILRIASNEVTKKLETAVILESMLDYLAWLIPYDCAHVILDISNRIHPVISRDYRSDEQKNSCTDAILYKDISESVDISKTIQSITNSPSGKYVTLTIPMRWEEEPLGVIVAERQGEPFTEEQIHFSEALVSQSAVAIHNAQIFFRLKEADRELLNSYDATIEGWSKALEMRDHETEGHTLRVTDMTITLARRVGLPEEDIVHIRRGALLHDIGKVAIPDSILLKPEPLTPEERIIMNKHPEYAKRMLSDITFLLPALDIPYCHHEKWDGTGYPRGLKEDKIPIAARIFSIIDVWDALIHNRPYHRAWNYKEAYEYIKSLSGSHFDPEIVQEFLAMLNEEAITKQSSA
ncbi:MAG TPA: HD domain-containing phosphohydrolase [Spirochaetia bacterium]|nr:HD domain-containing phosphohydrolase [Spirochaetales bacterium]HRS65317.1 HD domain-containing phosphohydrolase [Spirochaetia bacterium]HRV28223.1 HD domain-containing phosphohydrolase [Spirochaetia bacterium]